MLTSKKAAEDPKNDPMAPRAIREHFELVNATLRGLEKEHVAVKPKHLDALDAVRGASLSTSANQSGAGRFGGVLPRAAQQERVVA